MTSLEYEDIFSNFLGRVTDYQLLSQSKNDAYELMSEYLHKASSQPYVRRLFSVFTIDDDFEEIKFEMDYQVDEDSDKDFVINILAMGMVVEWVSPQVRSKLNLAQIFTDKERNYYSQANHISELRAMLEDVQVEQRKMIRDRGYIYNPYLEG